MVRADVVVIGAGIIGAACAEALSANGTRVVVLERDNPAGGTTAACEGNVLVSDKEPGPELALAQASRRRWPRLLERLRDELGPGLAETEWEPKGGIVAATTSGGAAALREFTAAQRRAGVDAQDITPERAGELEPRLTDQLAAVAYYPQDGQLQPVLAATTLLAAVRARGGEIQPDTTAHGLVTGASGEVTGVRTSRGTIAAPAVVNACGPWAGDFSAASGAGIAVRPRRGIVLVTAPLPVDTVRHKVYDADYVGAVTSSAADLRTSTVVESTRGGTVLIGSSRQRAGFDDTIAVDVLREIAAKALRLFPVLTRVAVMRAYGGFRPYVPDNLPVIGADPRVPGLWHASGHEGAGVGLAAATGQLLADLWCGRQPVVDPAPFRVDRPAVLREEMPA